MTDKERVLLHIISRCYPKYLLGMYDTDRLDLFNKNCSSAIRTGDLVLAVSSGLHDYTVGYVMDRNSDSEMVIREIGSEKTCNISNEMFYKIDKDLLSDTVLLEGVEYKTYIKVSKAISNAGGYSQKFHSITFNDDVCTVNLRKMFTNEILKSFSFKYNSKTTIKEIETKMELALKEQ